MCDSERAPKLSFPATIQVGGVVYQVIYPYVFIERSDLAGQSCHRTNVIRLGYQYEKTGEVFASETIVQTFWHEVLHCIDVVYNADNLEDDTVERLSQGLYQVLKGLGLSLLKPEREREP